MMKVLWSEQMIVNLLRHRLLAAGAGLLLGLAGNVAWAQSYVNATVDGQLAPGVYGRIQIGSGGPPPLIYAEPVIIQRPPVAVHRSPIYLYVPPGHAKNWAKHCWALQRLWSAGVLRERAWKPSAEAGRSPRGAAWR